MKLRFAMKTRALLTSIAALLLATGEGTGTAYAVDTCDVADPIPGNRDSARTLQHTLKKPAPKNACARVVDVTSLA